MIDRAPQVVRLTVDLHEHLVEVPAPMPEAAHRARPLSPDVAGKHRTEPVPPKADGFVTQIDAALEQEVFDVPQRQRKPHIHQHDQSDDLG